MTGYAELAAARAEALFRAGANCAQSVYGAFSEELGLSPSQALRISSMLGGGVARTRGMCGAVLGALLAAGTAGGNAVPADAAAKGRDYAAGQALMAEFRAEFGTLSCRELLGLREGVAEPATPDARTEAYYASRPCLRCIRFAAALAAARLAAPPSKTGEGAAEPVFSQREVTPAELAAVQADFAAMPFAPRGQRRLQVAADAGGAIAGLASGLCYGRWLALTDLWVRRELRGKGLGGELLRRLEARAREEGLAQLWCWTDGERNAAFYEKHGFHRAVTLAGYGEAGFDHIGLEKAL